MLISILYLSLGFVSNYSAQSRAANRAVLEINALRQLMGDERLEGFEEAHKSLDRVEQFVQTFSPLIRRTNGFSYRTAAACIDFTCTRCLFIFIYRKFFNPCELEGFAEIWHEEIGICLWRIEKMIISANLPGLSITCVMS